MKILVVDDSPQRYDRLVTALGEIGILRNEIDIVTSALDARRRIEASRYDLLLIDILLPLRPETEADAQHSIDLLFEIREGELPHAPRYILGITADPSAASEAMRQFQQWTWTVLNFSENSDEWVIRATNCVKYVQEQISDGHSDEGGTLDLAIICALAKPEQEEILNLPWNWSSPRPISDMIFVRDGYVCVGDRTLSVCVSTPPRMGMVPTAVHATTIITILKPHLIAMTGICAGVKGKVKLGDVLFADPSWDFQSGKLERDSESNKLSIRPHQIPASSLVRSHIDQIRGDKKAMIGMAGQFPGSTSTISEIHPGPVASGSAVLADGTTIAEVKGMQHSELLGIEMEIYGIAAAAHASSHPQPKWFALKGVCDFGDVEKDDSHQQFSAYASARVLQLLIERYGDRLVNN